jgi:hypothetical protein
MDQFLHARTQPGLAQRLPDVYRMEKMSVLTDQVKEFIVRGLARYQTPSEMVEAVRETYGIEVSRQQVYRYDPDNTEPPAQRWREIHAAARQAFLTEVAGIGVAHKVVRLKLLDRMTKRALENNYTVKAAHFLEQAARECGGLYDRRPPAPPQSEVPPLQPGEG